MRKYFLNRRPIFEGNYSVHNESCPFLDAPGSRLFIGKFESCNEAVREAKRYNKKVNGCLFCSKLCARIDRSLIYKYTDPVGLNNSM